MSRAHPAGGRLYVVATPIGNLEDITLRALRVLKEADAVAAEDTRHTLKLLTHFQIRKPLLSHFKDNEYQRVPELVSRMQAGERIALVTDAGTPAVSDPGIRLVQAARQAGIAVEVIPGPSALTAALMGAGLEGAFTFHGFLSATAGERRKTLNHYQDRTELQIFFLSPHRAKAELADLLASWGDRPAVLARELTKVHEEFVSASLAELRSQLEQKDPRGEYTLIVAGAAADVRPEAVDIQSKLAQWQSEGLTLNQAIARAVREYGLDRKTLYAQAHGEKDKINPF